MIKFILFAVLLAAVSSNECDGSECSKSIIRYYQTLNCTALYDNEACCPTRFDCTGLYSRRDKCYLNGVMYQVGVKLNGTSIGLPCDRCACQLRAGKASWNCTMQDCSNWQLLPDRCRRVFMKDTCCPVGVQCDNDPVVPKGFVCVVGNTTYIEGQVFEPPGDTCKRCVCQRDFNGSFDSPWCRKKPCNFELRTRAIQDGCAPIFYAHKHCCPIDWRCPKSDDRVVPHSSQEGTSLATPGQCKFGNLRLNVSDKLFIADKRCLECTCAVPPHVTCTKQANCQECNPKHCNTPNMDMYRELNCTPVHENGECCPTSYDCSSVYEHKDHCHFGGMLFHHKAELVGSDVGLPCEHCTCHVHHIHNKAAWSCAIPECFNWPALPEQCHHIVTQDNCCPIGVLCDNNSTKVETKNNKIFSCKVDGATYFEGHIFEPHGNEKPCKKCVCQRGFDGTFEGPWCDKLSCGYELHCWDKIQEGCVPVFAESEECCPTEWQCPSPNDSVIPATSSDLAPTSAQCIFGALRFNFLEMLKVNDHKCLMCTCYVPPILTCVHEPNCQEE